MALHESVLEEFGLTPRWVRRGMAASQPVDEAAGRDAAARAGEGTRSEEVRGAAPGRVAQDVTRDVTKGGVQTLAETAHGQMPPQSQTQAQARVPMQPQPGTQLQAQVEAPRQSTTQFQPEPQHQPQPTQEPTAPQLQADREYQPEQQAERQPQPVPPSQAEREPQATQQRSEPQSRSEPQHEPAHQPRSAAQSRTPEPPTFDAPPDDFAWFDDLPTEPLTEARREAPAPPAVQTLDWDALSERVAACRLCRLCEKRTNTVFGVGDRSADWMLIGEAPGEHEDRLGEPFVGQAGKLLDNMLRSLTLARDTNVYIANVIKCRPPGNRNPEQDEVARCEPYLQRQVSLVKPKLIVALGRFAAQSLLKTEASISSLRGRVHEYEGVPVIVTYHPAYLLRSLPDKAKAWADLCLARDTWRAAGGAPSNAPN